MTVIPILIGALGKKTKGLGNKGTGGDCSNYSIVEIGRSAEKSPEDLRRLAVTKDASAWK